MRLKKQLTYSALGWVVLCFTFTSCDSNLTKRLKRGNNFRVVQVRSVYDGDTFRADLDEIGSDLFYKNIGIRIAGIDTPEIRGKCDKEKKLARAAKRMLKELLNKGAVSLRDCKRGKYFRIVCRVKAGGVEVSRVLLDKELAVPYDGGKKRKGYWCK